MSHLKKLQKKHLNPNETVLAHAEGYTGKAFGTGDNAQKNGVLAVTAERVIFYRAGFLGEMIETIPIRSITSIERKSTMGYKGIRIHTSHDDLKFTTLDARAENAVVTTIEAHRHGPLQTPVPTDVNPQAATDAGERLQKINELLKQGLINEDEAQKKRAEILADF